MTTFDYFFLNKYRHLTMTRGSYHFCLAFYRFNFFVLSIFIAQCDVINGDGACPDSFNRGNDTVLTTSAASSVDGRTSVAFKRHLAVAPGEYTDRETPRDDGGDGMYIVWAMGRLASDGRVTKHAPGERTAGACVRPRDEHTSVACLFCFFFFLILYVCFLFLFFLRLNPQKWGLLQNVKIVRTFYPFFGLPKITLNSYSHYNNR